MRTLTQDGEPLGEQFPETRAAAEELAKILMEAGDTGNAALLEKNLGMAGPPRRAERNAAPGGDGSGGANDKTWEWDYNAAQCDPALMV